MQKLNVNLSSILSYLNEAPYLKSKSELLNLQRDLLKLMEFIEGNSASALNMFQELINIKILLGFWQTRLGFMVYKEEEVLQILWASKVSDCEKALVERGRTKPNKDDIQAQISADPEYMQHQELKNWLTQMQNFVQLINASLEKDILVQMAVSERKELESE